MMKRFMCSLIAGRCQSFMFVAGMLPDELIKLPSLLPYLPRINLMLSDPLFQGYQEPSQFKHCRDICGSVFLNPLKVIMYHGKGIDAESPLNKHSKHQGQKKEY